MFHRLPEQLQLSPISMAKKNTRSSSADFKESLRRHREVQAEKDCLAVEKRLEKSETQLIAATYTQQQFMAGSRRCWHTERRAREEWNKLTIRKEKLRAVKERILIQFLGLGWEEAYHPWSKGKHIIFPDELFDHLVNAVIQLEHNERDVPTKPQVELPSRPK